MRMIIAINNKQIEDQIINYYYSKYEVFVAETSDMVLKLSQDNTDVIAIIREDIKGNIDFKNLIIMLKDLNINVQIIVLVKELTKELKEMLFSKEVFSVIEGKKFKFEELQELIENPKTIIYKEKKINLVKSNIIFITGGRAVGKTVLAIALGRLIAKDKRKRVLVLDLDFVYPTMDTYLKVNKNYALADMISDLLSDNLKNIQNYESTDLKLNNLKYILSNKSIGIPSSNIIIKTVECLKRYYDYIVVDTSSLMLNKIYGIVNKKNYNIIYVLEPGKRAIKDFKMDTAYLEDSLLSKSIFICNKCNMFYNIKRGTRDFKVKINGLVKFSYVIKFNKWYLKYNLKNVLKELGINKIKAWKKYIIEKLQEIWEV
ncbi:MAG: hypothetical protein ACI4ON_01810 [Clostridia bacterium]